MNRTTQILGGLALMTLLTTTVGCGAGVQRMGTATRTSSAIAVVRQGEYTGELALTGAPIASHYEAEDAIIAHCGGRARIVSADEAQRLEVSDPGDTAKARDASVALDAERLYYVCVTRERAARRTAE